MGSEPLIECRAAGKVFRTFEREPGLLGLLRNFTRRKVVEVPALVDIELAVARGEMVGLIGANGAGKTTLVKCLVGIVPVSSGSARLFGQDSFHLRDEHKRRLSLVMGQRSQLWWDLPPLDSFKLLKEIYEIEGERFERRLGDYARRLGVEGQLRIQLRHLSLGQRMKMEFIGAFLHDPDVCFLDEPTIGLDLLSKEEIRSFLRELNREREVTIVLTSHDMEDIEETCERIVILERGRVLFDGGVVALQQRTVGQRAVQIHLEPGGAGWTPELEAGLPGFEAQLVKRGPLSLEFLVRAERTRDFVRHLYDRIEIHDLSVERQPLEFLIKEIFERRDGAVVGRRAE